MLIVPLMCTAIMTSGLRWQTRSQLLKLVLPRSRFPGILHCYDIPVIRRSNLDLESTFGTLRRGQRRVSGRKETTPIRVFGPGQIALLSLDDAEILPLLRSVPMDVYWSQRHQQAEREEPRRWKIRLHRDPGRALTQVDEQFYAVVKARIRTADPTTSDS